MQDTRTMCRKGRKKKNAGRRHIDTDGWWDPGGWSSPGRLEIPCCDLIGTYQVASAPSSDAIGSHCSILLHLVALALA